MWTLKVLVKSVLALFGLLPAKNPKILPYYKVYLHLHTVIMCLVELNGVIIIINRKHTPIPLRIYGVLYATSSCIMNLFCNMKMLKYSEKLCDLLNSFENKL